MTQDDFEQCRRRFGDDVSAWPAPFRQQGLERLRGGRQHDEDAAVDRLVLDAALMETDEAKLARDVVARLQVDNEGRLWSPLLSGLLLRPAGMAACAATLALVLVAGGYRLAGIHGDDALDSRLLGFAVGAPILAVDPAGDAEEHVL